MDRFRQMRIKREILLLSAKGTALWLTILLLSGCATYHLGREAPETHLTNIQILPRDGLEQRFLIDLNIINPEGSKLSISGLSYSLVLNGRKVASGVSGRLTTIPGFGESRVRLQASTNLISSLRVVTDLLRNPEPVVEYELVTKIRSTWWPIPLEITEQGSIDLGGYSSSAKKFSTGKGTVGGE